MAETPSYLLDSMVQRRRELQTKLETLLGSKNVYFQPPPNTMLKYPCFVYERYTPYTESADNTLYRIVGHYSVTYMDSNVERAMAMQTKILTSFDCISVERNFISDNLNHDVYNIYY